MKSQIVHLGNAGSSRASRGFQPAPRDTDMPRIHAGALHIAKRTPDPRISAKEAQSGYALLLILFLLALLVISVAAIAPTVVANIQREKEAEMIWRGKQYVRGVRMYYVKMHRFPISLDDLTKPKTGLRFMRQAYKDPMNLSDGSWRLIYVGPNGQLMGSLKSRLLGGNPLVGSQAIPAGQAGLSSFSSNSSNSNPGTTSGFGGASTFSSGFGNSNTSLFSPSQSPFGGSSFGNSNTSGTFSTAPTDANSTDPNAPNNTDDLPPSALQDSPTIMGGNIIGVGSKINKKSFMWYDKAKNYRLFEFIWDPSKDFTVGRASQGIGTPIQGTGPIGQNPSSPFSQAPGLSQTPSPNPQNPPADQQNAPQNQNPNSAPNQDLPLQAPPPSTPQP